MKREATLRARVSTDFANKVGTAAYDIGLNPAEYLRLALAEKLERDSSKKRGVK